MTDIPRPHELSDKEKVALAGAMLFPEYLDAAYSLMRPNSKVEREDITHKMALRWYRQPQRKAFVQALQKRLQGEVLHPDNANDLTNKTNLLAALQAEYRASTDPKDRATILGRISDICRMAKEQDTKEDVQRIHYYIPLKCDLCPFRPKPEDIEM